MSTPTRPEALLAAVVGSLPAEGAYVLSQSLLEERVAMAAGAADGYYYPVKADPDVRVLDIVTRAAAGLDLCSRGDLEAARTVFAREPRLCFTSPNLSASLAADLVGVGAVIDVDSVEQIDCLPPGLAAAGVRLCTADRHSAYGSKFGVLPSYLERAAAAFRARNASLTGLHLHDAHSNGTPDEMVERIERILRQVPAHIIGGLERINLGGGWPMPDGAPAPIGDIRLALGQLRERLGELGFAGTMAVEPGEWVIGPCTWLAARVAAVKPHPVEVGRTVVVLDVATPVPCRPCVGPFHVVRDDHWLDVAQTDGCFDVFGSANTGLDTIGIGVRMARPRVGDTVVVAGQGAYARQLTGSFNERPVPQLLLIP